ncbi:MAG: hypothetical protein AB2689_04295 [Candidatus Thiodiazotropha taylori]
MDDSLASRMFGLSGPILLVVSGIILLTFGAQFVSSELQGNIVVISGVMLVVLGGAVSALTYLRGYKEKLSYSNGDSYVSVNNTLEDHDVDRIVKTITEKLIEQGNASKQSVNIDLTPEERSEIIGAIKSNITKELAEDLFKSAKSALSDSIVESKYFYELRKELQKTKARLTDEIGALTRRGNLNLVIGGVTTILAVSLLGYVVLTANSNALELKDFVWHYIPRITVSVFIQIFSFFFLRLYRNSLEDIKYFQNELTNVDSRFASLEAALILGDKAILSKVIEEVSCTDRNSRLKKGESTVALEKLREENKSLSEMLGSAKELISSIKK